MSTYLNYIPTELIIITTDYIEDVNNTFILTRLLNFNNVKWKQLFNYLISKNLFILIGTIIIN